MPRDIASNIFRRRSNARTLVRVPLHVRRRPAEVSGGDVHASVVCVSVCSPYSSDFLFGTMLYTCSGLISIVLCDDT